MQIFEIKTLVDITETGQVKKQLGSEIAYQQQQNYLMLLQTISMRANPLQIQSPTFETVNVKDLNFGSTFSKEQRVWTMVFSIEYKDAYTDETGNRAGSLISDINFVPVTVNLTETSNITPAIFDTKNAKTRNTIITVVSDK